MKAKNYIGTSRPSGTYDKHLLSAIESNLNYFNTCKKKGILSIEHYVAGGDQWKLLKDGFPILMDITLEEIYYAIAAIINYNRKEIK